MKLVGPILIAGFGSVGRRHLRNLITLGYKDFVLFRTGKSTLPNDEIGDISTEYELSKALAHKPVVTIISNPTSLHITVALAAAKAGSHLFIEKPISHNLESVKALQRLVRNKKLVVQVGFQFRFNPGLRHVKRLLENNKIGPIVSVQVHWGEYLPEWHPWEDYRKSYSAKTELGGGVLLTLCHPFDYLRWFLGEVKSVSAVENRKGGLGIDVEDTADVLLKFKSGVTGHVHLNYIERPSQHYMHIIGRNGIIHWDNTNGLVKWYSQKVGRWKKYTVPKSFERNSMFLDEMRHFLNCISEREKPLCSLGDGFKTLKIVLDAKKSIYKKRLVEV